MDVKIISFRSDLSDDFRNLNLAWLNKYFVVEPHDKELLENCEQSIIQQGGYIFFAMMNNMAVGTFSLIKIEEGIYELGKMAVSEAFQGRKIGQQLLNFCITYARNNSWKKIILYSNTKLENAIYLYRKFGFTETAQEKETPYKRSNIKMELIL